MAHTYDKNALTFFKNKQYTREGQSLDERILEIVEKVREYEHLYSDGLADRIRDLIERRVLIPSTPQWSNFGRPKEEGSKTQPLNCSCNIVNYTDSIAGIYFSHGEVAMLSKLGAGVGASFLHVSETGTEIDKGFFSNDKLDWIEDSVRVAQKVSQTNRRGYTVPFISIEDKSFYDLMARADKKNPNKYDPLVTNNIGIILPEDFWDKFAEDRELKKRFLQVIQQRESKGKIYLLDVRNSNKNLSPVYEKLGHEVDTTNICTEVLSPSYSDKTMTCIIASLNLAHWDEIKENKQIIKDAYMFLDINVEEYIKLTEGVPFLERARKSAIDKRDIGLGTMAFHTYLQSKGFAFGDVGSRILNNQIFSTIREVGEEYAKEIGEKLGSPTLCQEAGMVRRNVSLMAIAPNKSSAMFAGNVSGGIEPYISNYFVNDLAGVHSIFKNPYLQKALEQYEKNTDEVWESISKNSGSVQHLEFLTQEHKDVFRTANEISPKDMIDLAADRQKYIDMAQSFNLFGRPNYTTQDVYNMHKYAFDRGIKTLYYYYPAGHAAIEKTNGEAWDDCVSCAD